jgi:hypothetical protein
VRDADIWFSGGFVQSSPTLSAESAQPLVLVPQVFVTYFVRPSDVVSMLQACVEECQENLILTKSNG